MSRPVRITGLLRIANSVRRELTAPLTAQSRARLQETVAAHLRQVDQILRRNQASVTHLPPPSQRAYNYLAKLDWSKIAVVAEGAAPAKLTTYSWPGLSGFLDRTMNRLAADMSEKELDQVGDTIAQTSRRIELTIQRDAITSERLSPATRSQRGWLGFFSSRENLLAYVQARRLASKWLDAAAVGSRYYPPPLTIHFRPMNGIYKMRAARKGPLLHLPTPMLALDDGGFSALALCVFKKDATTRQRLLSLLTSEGFQSIRAELESLGGIVEQTRGTAHDLGESFDRINAAYFRNTMPRPHLTWNRTFTGRKFGHYDFIRDTVMVSRTLDSADVPQFVVDFLVYHELLHKFHGLHWVNGRGYAHTREFYQTEKKFARYEEAEAMLEKIARSVR